MIPASEMFLAVLESKPRASGDDPYGLTGSAVDRA